MQMLSTDGIDRILHLTGKRTMIDEIKRFNSTNSMEARNVTRIKTKTISNLNRGGGGGGAQAPADTPADDMPDPDPRAGQF